ncbi:MAG: LysR family transcriptional regulator [Motiliproteus sp.]
MTLLRNLDLNLLVVFNALLSERHVTRAAETLHLSQSATSHALNRLRQQLDDPVLVRTERGMEPTPRALQMLPAVRQALKLVERTLTDTGEFVAATSKRTFVIAATDYFETVHLPQLVGRLQQSAPGIQIEVEMIAERASEHALADQRIDLVVGLEQQSDLPSHLISEPWVSESQVCVVGIDNKQVGDALTLSQYLQLPHVVLSDLSAAVTSQVDGWLQQQGHSRRHICRNLNYIAAARIVTQTDAVITLPQRMAQLICQMLPVRQVRAPSGLPELDMQLISHPFYSRSPELRWLKQQLQSLVRG